MIYKIALEKKAIDPITMMTLGHVGQNIVASKKILNETGGQNIVKSLMNNNRKGVKGFVNGVKNTAVPEAGIIRDEVGHFLKEIGDMKFNRRERAVLQSLTKGDFKKVINSKALQKSPKLQSYLKAKGIDTSVLQHANKLNPKLIEEYENAYKNNALGKMGKGIATKAGEIPVDNLSKIQVGTSKSEAAGETVGNILVGMHEPAMAALNGLKRLGADKGKVFGRYGKLKRKGQDLVKDTFVTKVISRAAKKGQQGKEEAGWMTAAKKTLLNPFTAEASRLANSFEVISNKHHLPSPFSIVNKVKKRKKNG